MVKNNVRDLVRVFVKGGIISPGDFLKVLIVAEKLGAEYIHFGSRQDILLPVGEEDRTSLDHTFQSIQTEYEINSFEYQNIASSYVSQDILPSKPWLVSHIYHYVLDSFDYRSKLRINVVDPSQSLVPLFTGEVNFVASNQENFWYVYLRFREIEETPWQMPLLVYTEDLVKVAKTIEQVYLKGALENYRDLFRFITETTQMNTQPVTEDLLLPETHFPYYEGINRLRNDKNWLGLYWRSNKYRISTMKAILKRCIDTEVGKVSLTPWKSFIIKDISDKDLIGWEKLMGKFGMNLRHSALELNWHLPALDQEALDLKFYLVRELDKQDISTYGLTFTIKTSDDITMFTSIVIEKNSKSNDVVTYNILHSKNFNANEIEYRTYVSNVPKTVLTSLIVELSQMYFDKMDESNSESSKVKQISYQTSDVVYQCAHCLTLYEPTYGDPKRDIEVGTLFEDVPNNYKCPTCNASKSAFQLIR